MNILSQSVKSTSKTLGGPRSSGPGARRLVAQTFVSMDGVMQAPGGPEEDRHGGFQHEGWSMTYWDEKMGQIMGKAMAEQHDILLGRRTYDILCRLLAQAPRRTLRQLA